MTEEKLVNEEIIDKPVMAKVKKGTKVIQGEGYREVRVARHFAKYFKYIRHALGQAPQRN